LQNKPRNKKDKEKKKKVRAFAANVAVKYVVKG
jgi:hypothetical protein